MPMLAISRLGLRVAGGLGIASAVLLCSGCDDDLQSIHPVAEPMVTLSANVVWSGYPVEMTYRFRVPRDASPTNDYHVMVHFADGDDHLLFLDDHDPPTSTGTWKPGQVVEYQRTWFVPATPYVGRVTIELALYAAGRERAVLMGTDVGQRSYVVGALEVKPHSERMTGVYRTGWHGVERSPAEGTEWHWTAKEGVVEFENPHKDSVLYLAVDNPSDALHAPQHVSVFVGETMLDQLTISPQQPARLHKFALPASALGSDATGTIRLVVDKTFVPGQVSPSIYDSRELGVRVFHAVVVPSR
jgi:hypothetical protein